MDPKTEGTGRHSRAAGNHNPTEDKRRRLFAAAEPLFERFGFRKTTIEDVCRAAGMSKRTFYDLFKDKQDLLLRLVESVMNDTTAEWESQIPADADPLSRLHSLLDWYARFVSEHPVSRVFVEDLELMRLFGEHLDAMRITRIGGPFDRILEDGIASGQFRPVDVRAAMWIVFGLLDTMYLLVPRVMNAPGPLEDPALGAAVRRFIVRGLGVIEPDDAEQKADRIEPWHPPVVAQD